MQSKIIEHHAHHHLGYSLFLAGSFLLILVIALISPITGSHTKAFGVSDIISLSNQARAQFNQAPLASSTKLMDAAQMKADDMARKHYFAHVAPDDGTLAWDYFKKVNYSYLVAGENLAITNETAETVVQGWLNSPTHRDNLLSSNYTDIGIGLSAYGDYQEHKNTYVIVAFYAKETSAQAAIAPTNASGISTSFRSKIDGLEPLLIIIGCSLILAGGILELRHIRRLHHKPIAS